LSEEHNSQTQRENDNLQHGDLLFKVIPEALLRALPEVVL
jgi:hypothetical protein